MSASRPSTATAFGRRRAGGPAARRRARCAAGRPTGPRPRGPGRGAAGDPSTSTGGAGADRTSSKRSRVATTRSTARSTSAQEASPRSRASARCWARTIRYGISMSRPAVSDGGGVAQPEDPVADDEALEAPLAPEDVGEELAVLAAPLAVDAVVRRHHRGDALVDDPAEVREVDLVQGDVVDLDVDGEAGVLHRVAREVLDAGHDVALQAPGQGGAELADVVRVLAVGLLGPAPRRVAQQVDADRPGQVRPDGPQLPADGVTDPLLEVGVPGRPPGHRHREAGGVADHGAAGPVAEADARQADPVHLGAVEGAWW